MKWSLISFVKRSSQRKSILLSLKAPKTPSEIAKEAKLSISHISRTLKEFMDKGIAECKTPKEKIGRIYILTKDGEEVLKKMSQG